MKITPLVPLSGVTKYEKINKTGQVQNDAGIGSDQVKISEAAQSFSKVYEAAQNEISVNPPEYYQNVQSVASRIEKGTYYVKSEDVAEKIVDEMV